MKILAIHTGHNPDEYIHAVDIWRVSRPFRELKKHVGWQIDERPTIIKQIDKYKSKEDFTEEELQKTVDDLKQYDIVFGSYTAIGMNPMVFALTRLVQDKYGTKFVMDVDDNLFAIKEDNAGWWRAMDHDSTWNVQTAVLKNDYLVTTNEFLANELRKRREYPEESVTVIPNFISKDYHRNPDLHDGIRIGYFGGASHLEDVHNTGMIEALEKIMHENKNVRFTSCGMPVEKYLPRARYNYVEGARGHAWINRIIPTLNYDISVAPLTDDIFADSKSDIKWQESAMIDAPLIASSARPYRETINDGVDGLLVKNTADDWYNALKRLVDDDKLRRSIAKNAKERILKDYLIENNWQLYKELFERIKK